MRPDLYPVGQPCVICGDRYDHYGVPHAVATGDGRTRLDVPEQVQDMAVRRFMYDAEFAARVKHALRTLDLLGVQRTVEIEQATIIGTFMGQWVFR